MPHLSSLSSALFLCASVAPALCLSSAARADDWKANPVWHDGLVEKAVYSATRVVYGKPRPYTATFFTNKEQHDRRTLTKTDQSKDTVEVWKHNHVEAIPTPNYTYHYVTTSHLTVPDLRLTRLDCASQEFCGASFKQYLLKTAANALDYFAFSYMPEAGRQQATLDDAASLVPHDALPLYLRNYDFANRPTLTLRLLPSQKSNRPTPEKPVACTVTYHGEENGLHKLRVAESAPAQPPSATPGVGGTYWFAKDRLHVLVKFVGEGPDKQAYELRELSRVDYWTIKGE
jgi:hypothetical protein